MSCEHAWVVQPEISGARTTRYRCKTCQRWGWRHWPRYGRGRKVQPIQEYVGKPGGSGWLQVQQDEFEEQFAERELRRNRSVDG